MKAVLSTQKSAEAIVPGKKNIREGLNQYKPDPVRRKEIPKPDGGVRKLGIPSVKDRVIQLVKRFLKSGVMENGVVMATEEGSPQGGPLSPLLANIYLNEFDHEYERRGVPVVHYANG